MTELERVPAAGALIPATAYTTAALRELAEWVEITGQVTRLVAPLVDTPFVPAHYQPRVDPRATDEEKRAAHGVAIATATAAVLQGAKLGLDPLTSLQQIIIIDGRPSMYAQAMVALTISKGHEVWTDNSDDTRCTVSGRRRGETHIHTVTITMEMARRAGWTKRDTYAKTPQDMLYARAASRVCKRVAPDALLGISTVEEEQDRQVLTAEAGSGRRTITPPRRPTAPVAELGTTPADAEATPQIQVTGAERMLDKRQWDQINELFREQGITGKGQQQARLDRIGEIVQRSIARGTDLTYEEGELILVELRNPTETPTQPAARVAEPDDASPAGWGPDQPTMTTAESSRQPSAGQDTLDDTGGASYDDPLLGEDWPPTPNTPHGEETA